MIKRTGWLIMAVIMIGVGYCPPIPPSLEHIRVMMPSWLIDSLRVRYLFRGESLFVDQAFLDTLLSQYIRVCDATDTNYSRPTSQTVDTVFVMFLGSPADSVDTAWVYRGRFRMASYDSATGNVLANSIYGGAFGTRSSLTVEASILNLNATSSTWLGYGKTNLTLKAIVDSLFNAGSGWVVSNKFNIRDSLVFPLVANHPATATVGSYMLDTLGTDTLWLYTQAGWLAVAHD